MLKRIVMAAILALIVANGLALAYGGLRSYLQARAWQREIFQIGKRWEGMGLMSQAEYVELRSIEETAKGRRMSERDMNWMLGCMRKHPGPVVEARVAGILQAVAHFTPRQRDRVFEESQFLLGREGAVQRLYGATLQGALADPRAIPQLLPLLDDPDRRVRAAARSALRKLGCRLASQ